MVQMKRLQSLGVLLLSVVLVAVVGCAVLTASHDGQATPLAGTA